jgi:cation-transporting P-type ATPase E
MMLPFPITPVQISWAAFGTVNMPAGFIAFGIIRPKYIERFRRDVIDYIITAGLIGAVALSVLFAVAYFTTGGDLEIARSAITIFICLFGMMIVWNVQGVEVYKPRTFIEHWQVVLISSLAAGLTIISFYALPSLFEFQPPPPNSLLNVLIVALFLLTMMIINHGMEHRYLLNRFWMLVEREKS